MSKTNEDKLAYSKYRLPDQFDDEILAVLVSYATRDILHYLAGEGEEFLAGTMSVKYDPVDDALLAVWESNE